MSEKLCVVCKHWQFESGSPDYSDLTPGEEAIMFCRKKHYWVRVVDLVGENDFREHILKAQTCPDFELVEINIKP